MRKVLSKNCRSNSLKRRVRRVELVRLLVWKLEVEVPISFTKQGPINHGKRQKRRGTQLISLSIAE